MLSRGTVRNRLRTALSGVVEPQRRVSSNEKPRTRARAKFYASSMNYEGTNAYVQPVGRAVGFRSRVRAFYIVSRLQHAGRKNETCTDIPTRVVTLFLARGHVTSQFYCLRENDVTHRTLRRI